MTFPPVLLVPFSFLLPHSLYLGTLWQRCLYPRDRNPAETIQYI